MLGEVESELQAYLDGIDPANRPLFDRIDGLILVEFPHAEVGIAYKMPVYRVGDRSLNVGVWAHGVSLYGVNDDDAPTLLARHPELSSGRGTLRIPRKVADDVTDAELVEVIKAVLGPGAAG
jgi:hypothetical protein